MNLTGIRALVTGSSQGIGQSIALRFAEDGADVVLNYRTSRESAVEIGKQIRALGRRCAVLQGDVGSVEGSRTLVRDAIAALGGLDVLVNNAGIEIQAPLTEIKEEDYRRVIEVNLTGPLFATQEFVRHLAGEKRPGKVINISSVHEDLPFPGFTPYCMAKGGLRMMTRNLAVELGPLGITVNNIAPGAIETPMNRAMLNDKERVAALLANIPLGRVGKPGDVASLASFLASTEADYCTGSTFVVDGGLLWSYHE
jgi:glucose 1-dehydrogenase